jgi:hypothetical protein
MMMADAASIFFDIVQFSFVKKPVTKQKLPAGDGQRDNSFRTLLRADH